MNEGDSAWKKWQVRVALAAGLCTILTFLLFVKERVFHSQEKPAASVTGARGEQPRKSGPSSSGESSEQPKSPPTENLVERAPSPKILPGQYINTEISRHKGTKLAAVFVTQESGESLPNLESAVASLLAKRGVEPVQSFFKPAFIQEGRAKNLFSGDWTISEQLQLGDHVDYVLIGFGKVTYSLNQELGGLLTANLELYLKCLNVVSRRICDSKTFATPGAGYTQSAALQNAIERLQPQLEVFVREAF